MFNVKGKLVSKSVNKYIIKWDKPSKSKPQLLVKQFLKPYWKSFIVFEEFPVYGTQLKVDFLNASLKVAIEVNGPQHNTFHYFHNNQPLNYLKSLTNDYNKGEWLEKNGYKLIEISTDEIDTLSKDFFKEKFNLNL